MAFLLSCAYSDNKPPFTSHEFKRYLKDNSVKHRRIIPLWPANSEAESFMKPLTKAIRSAHTEGKKWADICTDSYLTTKLCHIPLQVRHQPHSLFNMKVRNKLSQLTPKVSDKQLRETDQKAKMNYADTRWRPESQNELCWHKVESQANKSVNWRHSSRPSAEKQQVLYMIWSASLQGSKEERFNGNNVPKQQLSHMKCLPVQGSENGIQWTRQSDDSDNDTGDTQPDACTQSDPHTTAPALPAAPVPSSCPMRKSNRTQNLPQRYGNFRYHGK